MQSDIILKKSDKPSKKWKVTVDGKTIYFGASGYSDYTIHQDSVRKKRYIFRHKNNEDWNDIYTAGYWSRYITWNN